MDPIPRSPKTEISPYNFKRFLIKKNLVSKGNGKRVKGEELAKSLKARYHKFDMYRTLAGASGSRFAHIGEIFKASGE